MARFGCIPVPITDYVMQVGEGAQRSCARAVKLRANMHSDTYGTRRPLYHTPSYISMTHVISTSLFPSLAVAVRILILA